MPTYDYKCDACGHAFEKFQSISASPLKKCPSCAQNKLKRLIGTGAGVIFKGGGFYQTDYRSESYKAAAKQESGAAGGGGESKGESKGEAKPAASTDAAPAAKAETKSEAKSESKSPPAPGGDSPSKKKKSA